MGAVRVGGVAPGLPVVWRLWRNCLCRFGWYPIFVAPLITCAAFMDLYSSSGCDFIRLDIGFVPVNEVWSGPTAHLGLFSFDSYEVDRNKWKRSFNAGCQGEWDLGRFMDKYASKITDSRIYRLSLYLPLISKAYSTNFEAVFIDADPTWHISRVMAYISGISSLVALATAWLLTITPLPVSFFWPGVLLPASILSMLTGSAKFLFFDAQICSEDLWFAENSTLPVPPQSCQIGDSAVYAIASVAAYFLCTILICIRSPTKRTLDPNYGNEDVCHNTGGTVDTQQLGTDNAESDPERGDITSNETVVHNLDEHGSDIVGEKAPSSPPHQIDISNGLSKDFAHVRTTSDMTTWSTNSNLVSAFDDSSRRFRVLSPTVEKSADLTAQSDSNSKIVWDTSFGVFMSANEESRSYFDGKTQKRSNKSPDIDSGKVDWKSPNGPPLSSSIRTGRTMRQIRENDSGSVSSRISKVSFAETHFSEESFFRDKGSVASSANNSAPSVVSIPKKIAPSPLRTTGQSNSSSPNRLKYARREDRNDVYSDHPRLDSKRERFEQLPRLDELSSPRSQEDHGELINKCLLDLKKSFGEYGTL
ncbi:hypothetical protein HJC23_004590 [Cyclotella cryptica]|uniref:Uncharacterized protein n=1 Tax=Cyclotella cryptica TaxID=29204 RepID=A0ABD3QF61_9STRA|eukprot:CCRYP_005889-RA/>CCRYP_005889-RA protein AED:0.00 eAED:0.00 QI:171/-1/1/1/-1/1/1/201/588